MVDFHYLLTTLYEIQGLSDPNDSPKTLEERMTRIHELACETMQRSGFQPDPIPKAWDCSGVRLVMMRLRRRCSS